MTETKDTGQTQQGTVSDVTGLNGLTCCDLLSPYYSDDYVTIYHGDARELLHLVPSDSVMLTDPVYGIQGGKGGDSKDFGKGNYVKSGWEDSPEYVESVCIPVISEILKTVNRAAVTPGIRCLWKYPTPADMGCFWTPAAATHGPWGFTTMQPILYYGKDYRAGKGAWPSGKQVTESSEKNGHPCPKPLGAWTWLLSKIQDDHETVVDPFAGSGTTLRAAKNLCRKAIGFEIEEKNCEIAANRMLQEVLPFNEPTKAHHEVQDELFQR